MKRITDWICKAAVKLANIANVTGYPHTVDNEQDYESRSRSVCAEEMGEKHDQGTARPKTACRPNRHVGNDCPNCDGRNRGQQEIRQGPLWQGRGESARSEFDGGTAQRDCAQGSKREVGMMVSLVRPIAENAPIYSVQLANTFIERFGEAGQIDHLKLQKLCYYAYGWWLALREDQPPLAQSRPQVWKLGPVFQPVYSAFASCKGDFIRETRKIDPFSPAYTIADNDTPESQVVDWVWDRYGHFKGIELSNKTHEVGTPWHDKVKANNFVIERFTELSDDEIRPYFRNLAINEGLIQVQ